MNILNDPSDSEECLNDAYLGTWNVTHHIDGYITQRENKMSPETAVLYNMDRNGNITDSFSYEDQDLKYYIHDMIEFEVQVYLSAFTIPKK